jgi:muramidase (phage lysozyme)
MAINPQKLIPTSGLSPADRMAAAYDRKVDDVLNMQSKLINVDKFLKNSYKTKKKEEDKKKKKKQLEERSAREKKLELPKGIKGIGKIKSLIPATGILGAVEKFATFTFIGFLFTKFESELPKLLQVTSKIAPVANGIENIIGGIFEGTVGFIDAGYKAYDQMRSLSKDIGGEKAQKVYDDFSKNFNYVTNAILTLGLSTLVQPKPTKSNGGLVTGYASGGPVTRGGQVVGGAIGRTLKVQSQRLKQQQKLKPQPTQPGRDVGGKKQIEKLYPNPKITDVKTPNPYKALSDASKSLKQAGSTGILMAAGIDLALGQNLDFNLMNSLSGDYLIKSKVNEVLQNVRKEISKKSGMMGISGDGGNLLPEITSFTGIGGGDFSGKAENIPPEGKALLDAIAAGEGSYNEMFGGERFKSYAKHPAQLHSAGGYTSDAAGRYQFLSTTWDPIARRLKLKDFSPENQDIAAWDLAVRAYGKGEKGLVQALRKNPLEVANKLSGTWTSLPGGSQPNAHTQGFVKRFKGATTRYNLLSKVSGLGKTLANAASFLKGMPTSSGPEGGNKACVWAVNQVFKKAGIKTPWGNSNYVPDAEQSMAKSGYVAVKPGQQRPGDLYIVNGQEHIGIVLPNGNIVSNSSSGAKFSWESSLSSYQQYYGGEGRFYRIPTPPKKLNSVLANNKTKSAVGTPTTAPQGAKTKADLMGSGKQDGGLVGPQSKRNYSSLSMYPSYDGGGTSIAIQPIIIEKPVPIATGGNKAIMFPVPVSVNTNMASLSRS